MKKLRKALLAMFVLLTTLAGMAFVAYQQSIAGNMDFPWTYNQELEKYVQTPIFHLWPLAYPLAASIVVFFAWVLWQRANEYRGSRYQGIIGEIVLRTCSWYLIFCFGVITMIGLESWGSISTPPSEANQYFYLPGLQQILILVFLLVFSIFSGVASIVQKKEAEESS